MWWGQLKAVSGGGRLSTLGLESRFRRERVPAFQTVSDEASWFGFATEIDELPCWRTEVFKINQCLDLEEKTNVRESCSVDKYVKPILKCIN